MFACLPGSGTLGQDLVRVLPWKELYFKSARVSVCVCCMSGAGISSAVRIHHKCTMMYTVDNLRTQNRKQEDLLHLSLLVIATISGFHRRNCNSIIIKSLIDHQRL